MAGKVTAQIRSPKDVSPADGRERREPFVVHGEVEDQHVADEELRHRDGQQGQDVGETVCDPALADGCQDPEPDGDRQGDQCRVTG